MGSAHDSGPDQQQTLGEAPPLRQRLARLRLRVSKESVGTNLGGPGKSSASGMISYSSVATQVFTQPSA